MRWASLAIILIIAGCSAKKIDAPAQLSEEFSVIEGHLAQKPILQRKGKRIILYIGDRVTVVPDEEVTIKDKKTGEILKTDPPHRPEVTQPKLANIRKAVTENTEEEQILIELHKTLSDFKIGPEGPTVRLYGKHVRGVRWNEHVWGLDFVFCFIGYDDPLVGGEQLIDTCYGDRMQDDLWRFLLEKSRDGIKRAPKAIL